MDTLQKLLILDEGLKLKPYKCTAGKLTIGVGRNLDDRGITEDEALYILNTDIEMSKNDLRRVLGHHIDALDEHSARYMALVSMMLNLGLTRFSGFKNMISAIKAGDWNRAADEAINSRWYDQVGERGARLTNMLRLDLTPQELM